jgi:hypothetical protein
MIEVVMVGLLYKRQNELNSFDNYILAINDG